MLCVDVSFLLFQASHMCSIDGINDKWVPSRVIDVTIDTMKFIQMVPYHHLESISISPTLPAMCVLMHKVGKVLFDPLNIEQLRATHSLCLPFTEKHYILQTIQDFNARI